VLDGSVRIIIYNLPVDTFDIQAGDPADFSEYFINLRSDHSLNDRINFISSTNELGTGGQTELCIRDVQALVTIGNANGSGSGYPDANVKDYVGTPPFHGVVTAVDGGGVQTWTFYPGL
jgi:hypothetical protein